MLLQSLGQHYIKLPLIKQPGLLQKGFHPVRIYIQNRQRAQKPIQLEWHKLGRETKEPVIFYVE